MKSFILILSLLSLPLIAQELLAQDVTFDRALEDMVDSNVDVRVQQTKANAAESQIWGARGTLTPVVSLVAQQQNSGGNSYNPQNGTNLTQGQLYAATATWNVFRSGSDSATIDAALSDRDTQMATLADSRLQAESKSAQALLDLIENKKAVDVYRRSEANAKQFLDIAEQRFKKSLLSHEEMDKVALDAANAEARRADAETQYNATRGAVESLLGHSRVQLDWPWENRMNLELKEMTMKTEDAFELRPDYRAAKNSSSTEDLRGRSLYRVMYPTVDLNYTQSLEQVPGQSISGWSTTATLTIPLWNGYKDYTAYRVQVENRYAAEARVRQLERTLKSDVKTAQNNYKIAVQQYESRKHNLTIAQHIMDADGARFKIGRADANDLSLDLQRVTDAEILALQGIEQVHVAYVNLRHAFGERAL